MASSGSGSRSEKGQKSQRIISKLYRHLHPPIFCRALTKSGLLFNLSCGDAQKLLSGETRGVNVVYLRLGATTLASFFMGRRTSRMEPVDILRKL